MGGMNTSPLTILVIERHPLMREALCAAIADEPGMRLVAQAFDSDEALELVNGRAPDIVLYSLGNPGWDDLRAIRALRQALPTASILALTTNEVDEQERDALEAGAQVVLSKAAPRAELLRALRAGELAK
ncbi:MAG: DNA-binding response regulator [Chloroflexi bacterium]|nr:MAG: DNA-binding response regulator [Chloroflexota bacterium]